MLKLCTSSWNVSGHQPLLPPSKGVERWPGCLFVDAVFISFYVCVLLKAGPLNCTFPQTQMAWAHCISLTLSLCISRRGEAHFKRYKVLKTKKKKNLEKKKQENGKRLPFRTCSPAAHKQKSLLPVSVTALIQAQTDPIAEDLPASCTNWRTLTVKGVSHAAPASRGSPLYSSVLDSSIYVYTTYIYTVSTVCGITSSDFLDRNLWNFSFLFERSWFDTTENEQYVFSPQISDTKERIWVGCKLILDWLKATSFVYGVGLCTFWFWWHITVLWSACTVYVCTCLLISLSKSPTWITWF